MPELDKLPLVDEADELDDELLVDDPLPLEVFDELELDELEIDELELGELEAGLSDVQPEKLTVRN